MPAHHNQAPRETAREVYARKKRSAGESVEKLGRIGRRLSWARAIVFLVGAAMVWPILISKNLAWHWILFPVGGFLVLAVFHERILRLRNRSLRAVAFNELGLARLEDRWVGQGNPGTEFLDPDHPYAADLDLFGRGSLFEMICGARTRSGERTLAAWLNNPADAQEIRLRQAAVSELRDKIDLREDLYALGDEVRADDDPDALAGWGAAAPILNGRRPVALAGVLAVTNLTALFAWFLSVVQAGSNSDGWIPWLTVSRGQLVLLLALLVSSGFAAVYRLRVNRVLDAVEHPEHELELLAAVLARLERESFDSEQLRRLHQMLEAGSRRPSRCIAQLARLVQMRDSRQNKIFMPIAAMLLLGTQLALAMERWRSANGAAVHGWILAVGEFEALSSLAALSFERPEDPFPVIEDKGPRFDALQIGHPLLPSARCVRNDLSIGNGTDLLLVSGSNMSGKSTLMRTVGINTVLAQAGSVVRARSLHLSQIGLGTCMRVQDSLLDGTSHFYAEIKRLRTVVELAGSDRPLLFLLDEILNGTNSHDRRIGAEAVIRGLLLRGAIGLVTTHDLALAEIVGGLGERAVNVHLEDQLDGDRIIFDYRLKPGVVQRGNALGLMRAIGLQV